ncbi:hypothetical protein DPMN_051687 [Dreissena polymorpha]|uniref:Uncharacterized protein n=1 Tax=Dreissena polymorpha TaxID=45954 RepID=A0A9D4CJF6_DREPO|nr:hypothetical protein DPMN_051687 [Dreissena polymorpha]
MQLCPRLYWPNVRSRHQRVFDETVPEWSHLCGPGECLRVSVRGWVHGKQL